MAGGACVALGDGRWCPGALWWQNFLKVFHPGAESLPFTPNWDFSELHGKSQFTSKAPLFYGFLLWTKECDELPSFCWGLGLQIIQNFSTNRHTSVSFLTWNFWVLFMTLIFKDCFDVWRCDFCIQWNKNWLQKFLSGKKLNRNYIFISKHNNLKGNLNNIAVNYCSGMCWVFRIQTGIWGQWKCVNYSVLSLQSTLERKNIIVWKKITGTAINLGFSGRWKGPGDRNGLLCDKGNFFSLFISLCFLFPAFKASQSEHMGSHTMVIRWILLCPFAEVFNVYPVFCSTTGNECEWLESVLGRSFAEEQGQSWKFWNQILLYCCQCS